MSEEMPRKEQQTVVERENRQESPAPQYKKRLLSFIIVTVAILVVLAMCFGIYNAPANRLQRQLDLGYKYLEEQRYEEALLAFDRAIEIDDKCVEAYLGKAKACEKSEDYETAINLLEICHGLSGDSNYIDQIQVLMKRYDNENGEREKPGKEVSQEAEESKEPVSEWNEEAARRAYEIVLKEYINVTSISSEEWFHDAGQYLLQYPNVNQTLLDEYFTPSHYDELIGGDEPCVLAYSYFDIDQNGISELLLWHLHHEAEVFEIYAYNGIEAVALKIGEIPENTYESYSVFTDGTIWVYRDGSEYYHFKDDGYSVKRVNLSQEEMERVERLHILSTKIEWTIFAQDIEPDVTDDHLSEADLHMIFTEKIGNSAEIYFFYDDFDGDGINEAYGITGNYSEWDELYSDVMIYYISPDGACYCLTEDNALYGYLALARAVPEGTLLQAGKYKFLLWELSANGSGSLTYIFGAKKGMPYEPTISRNYMFFGMQSDWLTGDNPVLMDTDIYVGYRGDFSQGYHDYIPHYFVFDEEQYQFIEK